MSWATVPAARRAAERPTVALEQLVSYVAVVSAERVGFELLVLDSVQVAVDSAQVGSAQVAVGSADFVRLAVGLADSAALGAGLSVLVVVDFVLPTAAEVVFAAASSAVVFVSPDSAPTAAALPTGSLHLLVGTSHLL